MTITTLMIIIFVLGYIAIAFEHPLKIDKAASALAIGGLTWALFSFVNDQSLLEFKHFISDFGKDKGWHDFVKHEIHHHIIHISEILFFLLGAMTIVELIDAHEGFAIITDKIKTTKKVKLMWILCTITFFFSAALDNLTTAIVMATLIGKMIKDKEDKWLFAGMIILSANAGGAWSPIGDVTTIMLWIGGQVTASNIITSIFIPSVVCAVVPLIYLSFKLKGNITRIDINLQEHKLNPTSSFERNLIFYLGVSGLLFVPVFKIVTHLPHILECYCL